ANDIDYPITPCQETPKEGLHLIFKYTDKIKKSSSKIIEMQLDEDKKIKVAIDVKTDGGQFVVEPSVNQKNQKKYKWTKSIFEHPIPEMPDWLIDLINIGLVDKNYKLINKKEEPKKKSIIIVFRRKQNLCLK